MCQRRPLPSSADVAAARSVLPSGGNTSDSDVVSRLANVSVVPEPEAYALGLAGMLMVGLSGAWRRRKAA